MIKVWLLCVIGTALCWGAYGPFIHEGQVSLKSAWKAFLLVGGAYFFIAVLIPSIIIAVSDGENFKLIGEKVLDDGKKLNLTKGTVYGLIAGTLGALGALFVIAAMKSGGKPFYVMPLVFGLAPLVNVIVSSILHKPANAPHPMLYMGLALLAGGAGLVLYYKPT